MRQRVVITCLLLSAVAARGSDPLGSVRVEQRQSEREVTFHYGSLFTMDGRRLARGSRVEVLEAQESKSQVMRHVLCNVEVVAFSGADRTITLRVRDTDEAMSLCRAAKSRHVQLHSPFLP